jgi:ABC-type uncharacterized transport system involved in gliding motility auxiliary subunit
MAVTGSNPRGFNWLDRARGPLALAGGLALLVTGGLLLVHGEFSVPARMALAASILFLGMSFAIDPQKAIGSLTSRESRYGSNAVAMSVAFVGILVVVNFLASRYYQRWDLTAQRDFSLAEATLTILRDLPQPVHAEAFFSSGLRDRQRAEDLLKEYSARSNGKLTWEMIDSFLEPTKMRLKGVNIDGTIRFTMGDRHQDSITTEESYITTALIKLVNPEPLKAYYVTGHGERDLDRFDDDGYSELKTFLQRDNFVLEPLNLRATTTVPDDAKAIIIAAPKSPFADEELRAVNQYLDGKGRMVLLVDALQTESNAEELIKRWDLTFGKGVAVDPVSALPQDPLAIIVQRYGTHNIVRSFTGEVSVLPFSTTIQLPDFIKKGVDVNGLAMTFDTRSWLETNRERLEFNEDTDKKGPLVLAVAVEEAENPESLQETLPGFQDPNKRVKNRAVIIGTSEMAINGLIKQPIANRDFILNSLNWVTQTDQLITSRPYIAERRTVFLTPAENNFVFYSSFLFFPLILLGVGGVVWWTRR